MDQLQWMGKAMVITGLALAALGGLMILAARLSGGVGALPGDIVIRRPGMVLYLPLGTSVILSLVLTLILTLIAMGALGGPHR